MRWCRGRRKRITGPLPGQSGSPSRTETGTFVRVTIEGPTRYRYVGGGLFHGGIGESMSARPTTTISRSSARAIRRLTTAAFAADVLLAGIAVGASVALVLRVLDPRQSGVDPVVIIGAAATTVAILVIGGLAFATARIRRHAAVLESERTDLREAYDRARLNSLRDGLTGLGNHRAFQEELDAQVAAARDDESPLALLIIDVDDLKKINDRKGHAAGDELLRTVSQVMRANLRRSDRAYRLGGDEFALLLPGCDLDDAGIIANHLLAATLSGHHGRIGAFSVTIGIWSEKIRGTMESLLADGEPDVRRMASDALARNVKRGDLKAHESLLKLLADTSPIVRRAAALAIGRVGAEGAGDVLVNAWKAEPIKDPFLIDAYLRGLEMLGRPGIEARFLVLANSGQEADLQRVAGAFSAAMRTKPAAEAVIPFLDNPHLSATQRADLMRSLANYQFDPPLPMKPLADYLVRKSDLPAEIQVAGLDTLAATGGMTDPAAVKFVVALLDAPTIETRSAALAAVEAGRIAAAAEKLIAMAKDKDKPTPERAAALKALRACGNAQSVKSIVEILSSSASTYVKAEALADNSRVRPVGRADGRRATSCGIRLQLVAEAVGFWEARNPGPSSSAKRCVTRNCRRNARRRSPPPSARSRKTSPWQPCMPR